MQYFVKCCMWIRSSRRGWDLTIVDEIYRRRGWDLTIVDEICIRRGWDLTEWLERLTANAKFATWLGSIKASSDTVESERRQIKQCWQKYKKSKKSPCLYFYNIFIIRCFSVVLLLWVEDLSTSLSSYNHSQKSLVLGTPSKVSNPGRSTCSSLMHKQLSHTPPNSLPRPSHDKPHPHTEPLSSAI